MPNLRLTPHAARCAALAIAAALWGFGMTVYAQDTPKKEAAPAAKAGDAKAGDAKAEKQSAWVKLCEKATFSKKDKDGKDVKDEKNICLTHHERLDGNTGLVLVSAALRQVDGSDKQAMMIMVPLGMALPPGVRAAIYTKEQWDKAAKNEKIDEKTLKPFDLKYTLCHSAGCTAEIEATPEIIEQMKTGGGLMVLALNAAAQPIGFPVPLNGFAEAYAGKPIDNKEYVKARGELMKQIRARQAELIEKYKAEQAKKQPPKVDAKKADAKKADDGKAPAKEK